MYYRGLGYPVCLYFAKSGLMTGYYNPSQARAKILLVGCQFFALLTRSLSDCSRITMRGEETGLSLFDRVLAPDCCYGDGQIPHSFLIFYVYFEEEDEG